MPEQKDAADKYLNQAAGGALGGDGGRIVIMVLMVGGLVACAGFTIMILYAFLQTAQFGSNGMVALSLIGAVLFLAANGALFIDKLRTLTAERLREANRDNDDSEY